MGASPGDMNRAAFADAAARLTRATGRDDDLCDPFLAAVPLSGAVVSTLGHPLGSQTVCASSILAARVDEIQIDLGEGPCWEALRTRRPVLEPDLQREGGGGWPGAREALRALDVRALYAFPLFVGQLSVGSVDLYSERGAVLTAEEVAGVTVLAAIAARQVLKRAMDALGDDTEGAADGPYSRREMHQASGMVSAQLSIGVNDALVVLRGHAFSTGRSVRDVSAEVVSRRLVFEP